MDSLALLQAIFQKRRKLDLSLNKLIFRNNLTWRKILFERSSYYAFTKISGAINCLSCVLQLMQKPKLEPFKLHNMHKNELKWRRRPFCLLLSYISLFYRPIYVFFKWSP